MNIVQMEHISKSFGPTQAVRDVSFQVDQGEIYGILGPNGAGKTTTIRIMLDIFKPDSGAVSILGGPMTEAKKERIGYMPEERGLYQEVQLERCLIYLATLKGLSEGEARRRLEKHLERFELTPHRQKKVKELSKGMQQKAQIINTIIHEPELLIIDEPFTSLDPVNTRMVKELMLDLQQAGTTIIMSTHQMHQVEALCDRIVLIHEGVDILKGPLTDIRQQHAGHAVLIQAEGELPTLPGVVEIAAHNGAQRLTLQEDASPQQVLAALVEKGVAVTQFQIATPTLDEIFIRTVQGGD